MIKEKGIYNIFTGFISQAIIIAFGILIPRLFLTSFGSEYNGLLNTVGQAFAYLTLLEAGVGGASLQALYGPIARGNKAEASSIIVATGHYYRKTGIFYATGVILLSLAFPFFTKSNIPPYHTIFIILLAGVPGVVSYIFQGKYTILLMAEGKNYIITLIGAITTICVSIGKILLLVKGCNIIMFQACSMCISLLSVLFIYIYIRRNYKWIDDHAISDFKAIGQKNAVLITQISDLAFRNSSSLILAFFCDLKVVSVYALFNMLFSMVRTALDTIGKGLAYIMGQTYNVNRQLFIKYHDAYETYRMSLIFCLYSVALIFIIPFMRLYTKGITDANYLDYYVALLFVAINLLSGARVCEAELINYAQHFRDTQGRCILEASINVIAALILTPYWGIYGVLSASIIALIYRANDMVLYANIRLLQRSPWITYKRWFTNTLLFLLVIGVSYYIPWQFDSYLSIVGYAAITTLITLTLFWVVASACDRSCFLFVYNLIFDKKKNI